MCSLQAQSSAQAASTKSHYRGVRKRSENRFAAEIRDPSKGRRVWLGTFSSGIEAAHAYDRAARAIKGCKAKTNFPLSSFQNPKPVQIRRTAYKKHEPREEKVVVPSSSNSKMLAKAASRPWTHAYISKSFNEGVGSSSSSSPSVLQVMFPPELQRQQQLAVLKMSNQPRCKDGDGGMGSKESDSPTYRSDPSSSALTECSYFPTMGGIDLNLPAPFEGNECSHSRKTLWLLN